MNMPWLEPRRRRGEQREETGVGPVAGGEEEDGEEDGAVDAGPVEGVG